MAEEQSTNENPVKEDFSVDNKDIPILGIQPPLKAKLYRE